MGEVTGIAWTDHTFNPWMGCVRVSPGCVHCYAERLVTTRMRLPVWGVNAPRKAMAESYWREPERWNRAAAKAGVRRRVFCASLADVFEMVDREMNPAAAETMAAARTRLWALIESTPSLDWLLLTKRPENIMWLAPGSWRRNGAIPPHVWVGITAEDQAYYDKRWPILARVPAAVRFVSHEPALGPLTLRCSEYQSPDWVLTGGESGPGARPYDLAWARSLVRQTRTEAHRSALFVKQLGSAPVDRARAVPLRDRKGGDPSEWPKALRVQQFPKGAA